MRVMMLGKKQCNFRHAPVHAEPDPTNSNAKWLSSHALVVMVMKLVVVVVVVIVMVMI